ncbi:MAG: RNA polymerase factor sigma-54 [Candidatus Neomarinimicrobiota bacterium]|nr:RNA polymerase factor sigma-54 [Candidatus Neomarinimicrobiota bacterium]
MSKISTKIRQKQSIIPQQILQSRFLELSLTDIEEELQNEIEKNPVLVERDLEDFRDKNTQEYQLDNQENYDLFLSNLPEDIDVIDSLIKQVEESEMDSKEKDIGKQIIFNVDETGFLDIEIELIADNCHADLSEVNKVLDLVKKFTPQGVGCRDVQEYLALQIDDNDFFAQEIITKYFDEFLNQNFSEIKSNLVCSDVEFDDALKIISSKNLSPIIMSNDSDQIIPDLIIRMKDNKWIILVNDKNLNRFKIANDYLSEAMTQKFSDKEKKFIKEHTDSAQNLLDTIIFRSQTLKNVMNEIIGFQNAYLSGNQDYPNPLRLEDIATKLDMDISSISRVVKNKYVDTPLGIISLKSFFSSKIVKDSGEVIGTRELKDTIKDLIQSEDNSHPFSDLEISNLLKKKDISIARRTVAKYRESMNIPNVNKRQLK